MRERWRGFRFILAVSIVLCLAVSSCGSSDKLSGTAAASAVALDPTDINLVFVVTPDLAHNTGDVNISTANLTNRGLQRALLLARYLHGTLLNGANVNGVYALEPATHPQTANNYPDMVPLETIEQFALVNQYDETVSPPPSALSVTASSFPVDVSYTSASLPSGAAAPLMYVPSCQGIDFADNGGGNEALVNGIIAKQQSGFYVFALPFETLQSLLGGLKSLDSYDYAVPEAWQGPNIVYALSLAPGPSVGAVARLKAFDSQVDPGDTYPMLTPPYQDRPNPQQPPFVTRPSTLSGSSLPASINTNETVYFVRHGEAHPSASWDDGNLIMAGNWRALYLPTALAGKIETPDLVYAVDPAQIIPGSPGPGNPSEAYYSYVRTSQTVGPYSIANAIPLCVASGFQFSGVDAATDSIQVKATVDFFFTGGRFSNKTLLVGWEHDHIPPIAQTLANLYFSDTSRAPLVPPWGSGAVSAYGPNTWPDDDYDTVWKFSLDGSGNLTISNSICEGIDSGSLPSTPPSF